MEKYKFNEVTCNKLLNEVALVGNEPDTDFELITGDDSVMNIKVELNGKEVTKHTRAILFCRDRDEKDNWR